MNTTQNIFFIFVLLFAISCKKPPSAPQPDALTGDKAMLIGTWNWTYTHHRYNWCVGSELNETIEPEEDDYSFIMKEEGIIEFYKNEDLLNRHDIFFNHFTTLEDSSFAFSIYLEEVDNELFGGVVFNKDSLMTFNFPYHAAQVGCEEYYNYFK